MSVEAWKSVCDVGAVVALFLAFAFGVGVWFTGNIINDRQTERLRQFDKQLIDAKTKLGEQEVLATNAQKDLAGLQKNAADAKSAQEKVEITLQQAVAEARTKETELAEAQRKAAEAQLELKRFSEETFMRTRPRILDSKKFVAALKGKPKAIVWILFRPEDEETFSLGQQIERWLAGEGGVGWPVSVLRPLTESDALPGHLNRPDVPLATKSGAWWGLGLIAKSAPYPTFGHENDSPVLALLSALLAGGVGGGQISFDATLPDNIVKIIIGQEQSAH